jgi:hypothetical protein
MKSSIVSGQILTITRVRLPCLGRERPVRDLLKRDYQVLKRLMACPIRASETGLEI